MSVDDDAYNGSLVELFFHSSALQFSPIVVTCASHSQFHCGIPTGSPRGESGVEADVGQPHGLMDQRTRQAARPSNGSKPWTI